MNYKSEKDWHDLFNNNSYEISGIVLMILENARTKFNDFSDGRWDIKKYVVVLETSKDNKYVSIRLLS